ncbi:MAG: FIG005666: putative helicase [uncultured Thermomicrobiales bacterium]|uniref:FIG005666: putative helicase n=1 Tax=uncultured Thermomicrobiales bacterium TaxID=1645740 RepID=A0A6J4USQ6_9BACT|nr:MAG: FIG005666: putative helicase [uncultured Thermomicrobiales bacterium]
MPREASDTTSDFGLTSDRTDEHAADVALLVPVGDPEPAVRVGRPTAQAPDLSPELEAEIVDFAEQYPFALDGFQREAIGHFLRDESVLVAAPTGSGKTVVGEFGIFHAVRRSGRVFYTTPIKALSNQKFRDLRQIYGNDVGLLTGDVSENRDARILVMTTEILRNMLLQTPWEVDDVTCVIFDEVHYLADRDRGTTWEEAIILCPEHIQFICLSATVSNAGEIADWITHTHRPIRLVTHLRRAVPLALEYFVDGELEVVVDHHGKQVNDFSRPRGGTKQERRVQRRGVGPSRTPKFSRERDEPQPREIVDVLDEQKRLPAIYFLFSRNDCQKYAEGLAAARPSLATPEQVARIDEIVANHLRELRPEDFALEQVRTMTSLVRRGIGFHHAGLLPILKQLVEVLFGRGLMAVVFATDTLALGVNMPARTVVVGRMSKWDGRQRRLLIPNEFQQMAGRAGRRGMDRFGHVVVPFSPFVPFREMMEIATGPLHPVRSAFAIRYNTVLNLWDPPEGERVRQLLQESLAEYQSNQRVRAVERDLLEIGGDIVAAQQAMSPSYDETERLLSGYREVVAALTELQGRLRSVLLELDVATATQQDRTPWTEPGRHVLRRLLRQEEPGLVMHHRTRGWGVWLGRGTAGGAGLFLFGDEIAVVPEYRDIDFLPDGARVDLPDELIEPPEGIADATTLVDRESLAPIATAITSLDLPDLDARLAGYRATEGARLERRRSDLAAQVAALEAELDDLTALRDNHPMHDRATRKRYQSNMAAVDRLHQERASFEELLRTEQLAEEARVRGVIRGIRDVLHRFGYLTQGVPTAKADMLAGIFDNDGVILCEMIVRGWLDELRPEDLAEVFSWYCFDRDSRYANGFHLPAALTRLRLKIDDLERDVLEEEHAHDLFISTGHNATFYGPVRAWALGATMVEIGETIELSEGDLVLTFNKTIDLMRQVRDMLRDVVDDHPLIPLLRQSERLLRRGIVEQSLTLGFAPEDQPEVPVEGAVDAEMTPAVEAV